MMNVLVVCGDFPFPPRTGSNMRVYQLLRQVAARHNVTLLSYASADDDERVAALTEEVRVTTVERGPEPRWARRVAQLRALVSGEPFTPRGIYSDEMQRAIDELCASESIDVIQLEGAWLCSFACPPDVRVILDEHNIDYEVFERMRDHETSLLRRWFHTLEYRRFRPFEEGAWTRVDGCAVTSEREEPIVRTAAPLTSTAVVPNGVDLEYFAPSVAAVEPCTVVLNATLGYRPNYDAACHLVDDIWPIVRSRRPDAKLLIVGRATESDRRRLSRTGVEVTGEVPDIRPYLARATVVAIPVRMGGGTRLKVVEGLAMGKPLVSTTVGCEGVAVRDGEHLVVADGAEAFATRILELFDDDQLRQHLGLAGRRLVEAEYSWERAGERLEALYQHAAGDGARTTAAAGSTRR
jgi:polysaccharide biosynthesis protein PslH